jgi:hypothetical protein
MRLTMVIAVIAAGVLSDVSPAPACGCGDSHGLLVAAGTSPLHVPWRIRAMGDQHAIEIDFSYLPPGADDAGYGTGLPYPLPKRFTINAVPGADGVGDEQDVSGVTRRNVARVVITLSDGSIVTTRPRPARRGQAKHRQWLQDLRFFDVFFRSEADPTKIVAYDAQGHALPHGQIG